MLNQTVIYLSAKIKKDNVRKERSCPTDIRLMANPFSVSV